MKNRIINFTSALSIMFILGACASTQPTGPRGYGGQPNTGIATVAGAAAGGVIGSKFGQGNGKHVATGIGTLIGASIGSGIGQKLDAADRKALESDNRHVERAGLISVETGTTQLWRNPQTSSWGKIWIVSDYTESVEGQTVQCRDFKMQSVRNDLPHDGGGTACYMNGDWRIM